LVAAGFGFAVGSAFGLGVARCVGAAVGFAVGRAVGFGVAFAVGFGVGGGVEGALIVTRVGEPPISVTQGSSLTTRAENWYSQCPVASIVRLPL
jgi:hypothetical protein